MHCAKFGWNWPSGSGELSPLGKGRCPSFEQSWIPITQGCIVPSLVEISPVDLENCLPLEKAKALHLNKFESLSPKDAFVEICPVVLEQKDFKILSMYFCYLVIISCRKKAGPSFDQAWIPFTQGCFVSSLVEIAPVVLTKKMKMWKVYDNDNNDNNNNNNDNGQWLSAQVS